MCDIIDNMAGGKPFKYCRTHKVEPQDCPQSNEIGGLKSFLDANDDAIDATIWTTVGRWSGYAPSIMSIPKSVFKVGDKVRIKHVKSHASKLLDGAICEVEKVDPGGIVQVRDLFDNRIYIIWPEEIEEVIT